MSVTVTLSRLPISKSIQSDLPCIRLVCCHSCLRAYSFLVRQIRTSGSVRVVESILEGPGKIENDCASLEDWQ